MCESFPLSMPVVCEPPSPQHHQSDYDDLPEMQSIPGATPRRPIKGDGQRGQAPVRIIDAGIIESPAEAENNEGGYAIGAKGRDHNIIVIYQINGCTCGQNCSTV